MMMKQLVLSFIFSIVVVSANAALTAPNLVSPSNGATVVKCNTILDWEPVTNATKYRVEFDTSATFSNPMKVTSTGTAYQTNELLFGETYHWRVKALSPSDSSSYSDTASFTVFYDEFTLNSPVDVNGSGNASASITIVDNPYVVNDIVTIDGVSITEGVNYSMGGTATGTASALANAINLNGSLNSKMTASSSANVVSLTANNPGTAGNQITLSYTDSIPNEAIELYGDSLSLGTPPGVYASDTIYITDNSVLSGDIITFSDSNGTKTITEGVDFTMGGTAAGSATAIANAINNKLSLTDSVTATAAGNDVIVTADTAGTWGEFILITYTHNHPNSISLSGSTFSGGFAPIDHVEATLNWGNVSGLTNYEYELDTTPSFNSPDLEAGLRPGDTSKAVVTHLRFDTYYYWRVRAMHSKDTSGWSSYASFYTPKMVTLDEPGDNDSLIHPKTDLTWIEMKGSEEYEVRWDTTTNYNSPLFDDDDPIVNSATVQNLYFGTEYFWSVRALNSKDTSLWSGDSSFVTIDTVPHQAPADGKVLSTMNTTLKWDSIVGATKYLYQYSKSPSFTGASTFAVNASSGNSALINISSTDSGMVYYWRVRALHSKDSTEWSQAWSFIAPYGVGIEEKSSVTDVVVYPNPAEDVVQVSLTSHINADARLSIVDVTGKVVYTENISIFPGKHLKTISVDNLAGGVYNIRMNNSRELLLNDKLIIKE